MSDSSWLFLVDMDETLYPEQSYVLSGFRAVAVVASDQLQYPAEHVYRFLKNHFHAHGREGCLDALLASVGRAPSPDLIREWVAVYRGHQPDLQLHEGAVESLLWMRRQGRVMIVTDGATGMQQRKFEALGLSGLVDDVVYCDAVGAPKPDPASVSSIVQQHQGGILLVGDRPDHDLALAGALGVPALRVCCGFYAKVPSAPWQPVAEVDHIRFVPEVCRRVFSCLE